MKKMDNLEIAEVVQFNLKNLQKLKNDPSFRTIYMVVCGQVDTLVRQLEEEYDAEEEASGPGEYN